MIPDGLPVAEQIGDDVQEVQQQKNQRSLQKLRSGHSQRQLERAVGGEVVARAVLVVNTGVVSSVGGASVREQEVSGVIDSWFSEVDNRREQVKKAVWWIL